MTIDELRAEVARLRAFLADFAATEFEAIRHRTRDPQDELDPVTDHAAVEAWQDDARALIAPAKGGA